MKNSILRFLRSTWPLLVVLALVNFLVLRYINYLYPVVGHDYYYVLPHMLDLKLHNLVDGFGVQWYTPTFGGGLPVFANPISFQFSILQFSFMFLDLWSSVLFSIVLTYSVGMIFTYLLAKNRFGLAKSEALLVTLFYGLNGYTLNHLMAGHIFYSLFLLCPLVLYIFSSVEYRPIKIVLALASVFALSIYSGGFQVFVGMALCIGLCIFCFPQLGARLSYPYRRVAFMFVGLGLGMMVALAKINAAISFMSFFPREVEAEYAPSIVGGIQGILIQLLGYPFLKLFKTDGAEILNYFISLNGNPFGLWEQDTFVPISVFVLTLVAALVFAYGFKKSKEARHHLFATKTELHWFLFSLFIIWIIFELVLSRGFIFAFLKSLPLLKSMHVNIRYTSAFVLPLCLVGGLGFNYIFQNVAVLRRFKVVGALLFAALALYQFTAYEERTKDDRGLMIFDVRPIVATAQKVADGERFVPVKYIMQSGDEHAIYNRVSNTKPYEPIFGYRLENLKIKLTDGGTETVSDGKYNITNPSSLVFPRENGLELFDRISVTDSENFQKFINRQQPSWQISTRQRLANYISVISLLLLMALFFYLVFRSRVSDWLCSKGSLRSK